MGDIAEMILNGDMCEKCGNILEDEKKYPHLCSDCDYSTKGEND